MTINNAIIKELENIYRKVIPADLRRYLLAEYAEEPFPYEYSEQVFTQTSARILEGTRLANWMSL